jgi:hypothetical protein
MIDCNKKKVLKMKNEKKRRIDCNKKSLKMKKRKRKDEALEIVKYL